MKVRTLLFVLALSCVCLFWLGCDVKAPPSDEIAQKLMTEFNLPKSSINVWGVEKADEYGATYKVGIGKTDYLMKFRREAQDWRWEQVKVGENWMRYNDGREAITYNLMRQGLSDVTVALKNFLGTNNRYPSSLDELKNVSTRDAWGNAYVYEPQEDFSRYQLTCMGPDGKLGGGDDVSVNNLDEWSR